jgi:ABC-type lipoprotein release transport system permease subunit
MIPLRYNLRSLAERRATSAMTTLGVAMVAMIFVILFGFVGGLKSTLLSAGNNHNWIVLERGALSENSSGIAREQSDVVRVLPQIATTPDGQTLISPEVIVGVNVSRDNRVKQFALLRGVTPLAYQVHHGMRLVSGRWPQRGNEEWVIGQKLAARYPYLAPGTSFHYDRHNWKIVGIFSDNGSARESEILTDNDDLRVDKQWKGQSALHIVLKPGADAPFQNALQTDGRLKLDATSEPAYYASQTKIAKELQSLGLIVAIVLAIAAIFGGMNTMYTAVARRQREIGVMRVLGFSRANIMFSFVAESAILGLAAGVVGVLLASIVAWMTGLDSRLMTVGTIFFSYRPTTSAILAGLIAAATIGVVGGMLPAWRAARIGVIEAIREA